MKRHGTVPQRSAKRHRTASRNATPRELKLRPILVIFASDYGKPARASGPGFRSRRGAGIQGTGHRRQGGFAKREAGQMPALCPQL